MTMGKTIISAAKTALSAFCLSALLVSCDEAVVLVDEVGLDETAILLYPEQTHCFKATLTPSDATETAVSWSSSNPEVASISEDGVLTARKVGGTTVTVTSLGSKKSATCEVTVIESIVPVVSVGLDKDFATLLVGETGGLSASVFPSDATTQDLMWSSSVPEVVEVDQEGGLRAVAIGKSVVTVTTVEGRKGASCIVTVDASSFTVTFESNGGSAIESVVVDKDSTVEKPLDPVKESGFEPGLYADVVDPESGSTSFGGWFTDPECAQAYDFSTPVMKDITLYAQWVSTVSPIDISSAPGDNGLLCQAMAWLNAQTLAAETTFTFVVTEDNKYQNEIVLNNAKAILHLIGKSQPRVLGHNWAGKLIKCEAGQLFIGENITITGDFGGNAAIHMGDSNGGGCVTMLNGSRLTGCTSSARGLVYLNDGSSTFTLDGGEIVGNTMEVSGNGFAAMISLNWGKIAIKSGKIAGNAVVSTNAAVAVAGGIFAPQRYGGEIVKTGGVIENNTAGYSSGVDGDHSGQQVLFGATSQVSKGIYAINENVADGVPFSTDKKTDAPWVKIK